MAFIPLILSLQKTKKHSTIQTIHLFNDNEKSASAIRDALYKLDLKKRLIFCMSPEISKIFKSDYGFNDHGIYYDVYRNASVDGEIADLEKQIAQVEKRKLTPENEELLLSLKTQHSFLTQELLCCVVFMEPSTMKRDFQRFMDYEDFQDPIYEVKLDTLYKDNNLGNTFILDIETTGLDFVKDDLVLIGIKPIDQERWYCINQPDREELLKLLNFLEGKTVIGHNLMFDVSWLYYKAGLDLVTDIKFVDTMLLAHISGERRLSLKHLSMMYGNFKGRRGDFFDLNYLLEDLLGTELIYNVFKKKQDSFAFKLVSEATRAFIETRISGVHIDESKLYQLRDYYQSIEDKYPFSANNSRDVANYLQQNGVKLSRKTARGDYKVDQETLTSLNHPIADEFRDYKRDMGIYTKFVKPYVALGTSLIRPDILLWGTETGRLSSSNPNAQQVPNRSQFKDIFRSRFKNGFIASIDLDQAELRVAALLSNDELYAQALLANDFHRLVASKTFGLPEDEITKHQRFVAKAVNFGGVLYGGSAKGIATRINVETEVVAKVQDWYSKNFVKLTSWMQQEKTKGRINGFVETFFGRHRKLENMRPDEMERIAVNTKVQSVASDIMIFIVSDLAIMLRKAKMRSKILFPVHDELLLDIHPDELEQVIEMLQKAFKDLLKTPLKHLPLINVLPISGTLEWGESWLYLKSDDYKPIGSKKISSLGE